MEEKHMQMQRLPLVGDHLFGGTTSKSKSFPGGESLKDSDASRWSAVTFFSDTTKLVLDSGGLLMEATNRRAAGPRGFDRIARKSILSL
jgi:hypothetical protein